MRIVTEYDEKILKAIAKKSGNRQLVEDVSYMRAVNFRSPEKLYCERLEDRAFYGGQYNKDYFKLICIGVGKEHQGKGYGRFLLKRALENAKKAGYSVVRTRTNSGADFYAKWGGCICHRDNR